MPEEVIELSVEETNALRAELGLAPLRLGNSAPSDAGQHVTQDSADGDQKEVLELSVNETNDLRKKLGLAPLRDTDSSKDDGKSARQAIHKPAVNTGEAQEIQKRMERSQLKRDVQTGIDTTFSKNSLAEEDASSSALSWAAKMRSQPKEPSSKKAKKKKSKQQSLESTYNERDLEGMTVSHGMSELEAGSTTIMTLADAPLLKTKDDQSSKVIGLNEESLALENVELTERQIQKEGLRKKREAELGMGRAGGYAGFDDDEFEELGGTQGPSRFARGQVGPDDGERQKRRGFKIGAAAQEDDGEGGGLFAFQEGKAVSLAPTKADVTASDFMTVEEDEQQSKKKKKKDAKFKKKKKKKEKRNRRKEPVEESDDEAPAKSLLETLEETAVGPKSAGRKRRRSESHDVAAPEAAGALVSDKIDTKTNDEALKRAKYDKIMEKGNLRTAEAFKEKSKEAAKPVDEEPDDAFLNAALAKARRLRRLKEMSSAANKAPERGADAVARAVQSSRTKPAEESTNNGGITFAVDDTREFTRALRARAEQEERMEERKEARKAQSKKDDKVDTREKTKSATSEKAEEPTEDAGDEDADMMELAKEVEEEPIQQMGGFDETATSVPMGRGLAGALDMLRHTGEITGKNAGKEELRGRAKDERNYEDYQALDLSKVVKIGRGATEKDREFADREIKLEYRDEHGRLLTRKEAYRELCYQFHGHGSSHKNEEKKLRQIARERAEGRVASRQVAGDGASGRGGTLGALKATQEATGKAFVVHRT